MRLSVADLAGVGDELAAQLDSGGEVEGRYEVDFEDGTRFTRDSSAEFLANLDPRGERFDRVSLSILAWTGSPGQSRGGELARSVDLRFRGFGAMLQVASNDPIWGKGAVASIRGRLISRYRPWYAPLLTKVPQIAGFLFSLPFTFVVLAILHERRLSVLLVVVIVLSALFLLVETWGWRQFERHRLFAHTVIYREPRERSWFWMKIIVGAVAFAANVATLIALLVR